MLIDTWTDARIANLEATRDGNAPRLPEFLRTIDNDPCLAAAEIERLEYERIRHWGRRFAAPRRREFYCVHPLERI